MTTPEDLAKAREISENALNEAYHDRPVHDYLVEHIAAALAEARTAPKPAAEVLEALEALIERSEAQEQYASMQRVGRTNDKVLSRMAKTENALQQARAALAALKAKGTDNEG